MRVYARGIGDIVATGLGPLIQIAQSRARVDDLAGVDLRPIQVTVTHPTLPGAPVIHVHIHRPASARATSPCAGWRNGPYLCGDGRWIPLRPCVPCDGLIVIAVEVQGPVTISPPGDAASVVLVPPNLWWCTGDAVVDPRPCDAESIPVAIQTSASIYPCPWVSVSGG